MMRSIMLPGPGKKNASASRKLGKELCRLLRELIHATLTTEKHDPILHFDPGRHAHGAQQLSCDRANTLFLGQGPVGRREARQSGSKSGILAAFRPGRT